MADHGDVGVSLSIAISPMSITDFGYGAVNWGMATSLPVNISEITKMLAADGTYVNPYPTFGASNVVPVTKVTWG